MVRPTHAFRCHSLTNTHIPSHSYPFLPAPPHLPHLSKGIKSSTVSVTDKWCAGVTAQMCFIDQERKTDDHTTPLACDLECNR